MMLFEQFKSINIIISLCKSKVLYADIYIYNCINYIFYFKNKTSKKIGKHFIINYIGNKINFIFTFTKFLQK